MSRVLFLIPLIVVHQSCVKICEVHKITPYPYKSVRFRTGNVSRFDGDAFPVSAKVIAEKANLCLRLTYSKKLTLFVVRNSQVTGKAWLLI